MDFEVYINDRNLNEVHDNSILDARNDDNVAKGLDQSQDDFKISNFLSSRLELMKEEFNEKDDRKSLFLLSRQYPSYRHYTYRGEDVNTMGFAKKYRILPEIRGQNLFSSERERYTEGEDESHINVSSGRMDTLHQLQNSILRYGSNNENVWMRFTGQKYQHKLVRPGFSARRYMANLARNLNETLVKKLICDGYILEKNLFTTNSVMPHIRRRLSDDLSRYPEPYRILKQMLMAPGPLNEFSFIWGRNTMTYEDELFQEDQEMGMGDIKILFKKNGQDGSDEFEEVHYANLSNQKKKTILSNLLVKSAMTHALKIKEEMMDYDNKPSLNVTKNNISNIHIPVIKFDIKRAITELLNNETLQTLTTTQMEIPYLEEVANDGFKGHQFRGSKFHGAHPPDTGIRPSGSHHTSVFNVGANPEFLTDDKEDDEVVLPQNLTLRLNQTRPSKLQRQKKLPKLDPGRVSESSENVSHIFNNPSDNGLKTTNSKDRETQGNAFAEMIKKKAEMAASRKENIHPYGKYKVPNSAAVGDIDPTVSFSNWKYKEDHNLSVITDSGHLIKPEMTSMTTSHEDSAHSRLDQSRLINLLRGQADSVAEEVLGRTEGGVDLASDVNVAIRNIVNQTKDSGNQIWNLDVENVDNPAEYQGLIKDIFKSIFKDEVQRIGGEDMEVSASLMTLLQTGYNLRLEDIEMVTDPSTGKLEVVLKQGVSIPPGIRKAVEVASRVQKSISQPSKEVSMEMPKITDNGIASALSHGAIGSSGSAVNETDQNIAQTDEHFVAILRSPSGKVASLQDFIHSNNLVAKEGLLFDIEGGHYAQDGQYFDKNDQLVVSKSMKLEQVAMTPQLPITTVIPQHSDNIAQRQSRDLDVTPSDNNRLIGQIVAPEIADTTGAIYDHNEKMSSSSVMESNVNVLPQLSDGTALISEKGAPIKPGAQIVTKDNGSMNLKKGTTQTLTKSKMSMKSEKGPGKTGSGAIKERKKKKKDFIFGPADETNDIINLYSEANDNMADGVKTTKSLNSNKKKSSKKIQIIKPNDEINPQRENTVRKVSGEISFTNASHEPTQLAGEDTINDQISHELEKEMMQESSSEDEILTGDGGEARRQKMIKRQERQAQRKAEIQRKRMEEDMKRKREEEERRSEAQRLTLEDALRIKLEEDRKRKEEEYLLQKEKEKEEELALLEVERRKEYFRLRQIEKERQQKEEYARRREEARMRQEMEERLKREEQEMREREEAAMLEKLNEQERNEYLRRKAELLELQRLEEEKERLIKEENARLALEEAKLIAQKQVKAQKLQEESQRMRIEDEGLKKYLNVTPAFVWSYFEFLNMLGINGDPAHLHTQTNNKN